MSCTDDEGEAPVPKVVSDYSFFDHNDEPISFSELSLIWDGDEKLEGSKKEISLGGTTDNGLQKIFEQVVAWKFDSSSAKPEIFVLSKKKNWIKLLKPRKSFENTIRTIMISVHCLNFLKRNPETSEKALWDHLAKVFSLYEPKPSENDLVDHMNLIREAVKRDEILTRSKVFVAFLQEKPHKKNLSNEAAVSAAMSNFIVDDVTEEAGEDSSGEEDEDFFESVCAICDNGGELLCCEGKCMRSFHATEEAGLDSACASLGFSEEQVNALATFECKNCQYKQHQCFICGQLGSSDKSAGAEVFQCVTGTCRFFYHPRCVSELLNSKYGDETKDLEGKIAAGEPFMCPLHKCYACKELEPEDNDDLQLQFAVCRRCPRAYHRKCLPRKIAFEGDSNFVQRAWEGLMPNRILIYCLKHEIEDELATPVRDHIRFPDTDQKKKKESLESIGRDKSMRKERVDALEDAAHKKVLRKQPQRTDKLSAGESAADSSTQNGRSLSSMKKALEGKNLKDDSKVALNKTVAGKQDKICSVKSKASLGNQLYDHYRKVAEAKEDRSDINQEKETAKPSVKELDDSLTLDADSKRRILSILREAESSITLEDVTHKHQVPSTHAFSSKYAVQSITLGKLEGTTEALRVALQKLEGGDSIEDAKAVCGPGLLTQITKWRAKLKVFLAPFLYGPRYTSFGRHFTKVEKLKLICEKLHFYVQDGDMIVDFCCGSNDFSWLMKEKLDQMGKNCSYKNYDIFPAKNDFNFEKRDWMTVRSSELPPGEELIMGLNPPFGANATLANQFIEKALEFKPKLLIIIAPRETLRLDERKRNRYDLVWEDQDLLRDKSFYLPGSVDANGKQMEDWNVNVPRLSLWSRPDWTHNHKAIALKNGHLFIGEEGLSKMDSPDCDLEINNLDYETPMVAGDVQDVQQQHEGALATENGVELFPHVPGEEDYHAAPDSSKDQGNDISKEVNKSSRKRRRGRDEKSSEQRSVVGRLSPSISGGRPQGNHLSKHPEMYSHADIQREGHQHFDNVYGSELQQQLQRRHGSYHDDAARRNSYSEEPISNILERRTTIHQPIQGSDYRLRFSGENFPAYQGREADIRARVQMYGHQDSVPFSHRDNDTYFTNAPLSMYPSSYSQHGSVANPPYDSRNVSAMQRYAPRLDELNHTRMQQQRQPYPGRSGGYGTPPNPEYQPNSLGFASGPYRPYSAQNSSGWLND